MARTALLVCLAAFMPVADAWRVGDAAPWSGAPSGGRPGLRGKSLQGTATPAFQVLPSMGMGKLAGARRQGISLAPPPRLKLPQSRQGRFHLAPFGGRGMRMAQQPSTPPMEQTSMNDLEEVYGKMESGQIESMEQLNALFEGANLPKHPRAIAGVLPNGLEAISGVLPNGLEYTVLPNASPAGRFEVHLQIKAGSADELASQQGMAHMCEHVSYMGSRKRERLFGTSSQTNAQTDFHHTVYWAACPTNKPNTETPMLPLALEAVLDVMEAKFEDSRVEKERQAILSEAAMVNTIDYRVEVQLLAALHSENRLHKRFPIGLVQAYHNAHYRPNNAHLYVIGEVDPEEARALIKSLFSRLPARAPPTYPPEEGVDETNLSLLNSHFPPINHEWAGARVFGEHKPKVHIFRHELMQCFSMHIFAKFPVEPIETLAQYRAAITKRLVMVALQVRLNVHARGDPISMVEFSYLDSPREACAVCALDLMAEASGWEEAASTAVREIKRLAKYGLSQSELQRCLSALRSDCAQLAAQGDRMSNQDMLTLMMESVACGHTFMAPDQLQFATEIVAQSLTLEEVNDEAASLCAHIADFGASGAPMPSSVVACCPADINLTEDMVIAAFTAAAAQPDMVIAAAQQVENSADVAVPSTLAEMRALVPPSWIVETPDGPTGVVMKTLQNGIKVNYRPCDAESQRAHLRVTVPSGRMTEVKAGALALGARTMQEGGAMRGWTREQVELFCVDHLIMAEIACNEEFFLMEFVFPTSK
ncbi:hypothetical protein T484DRAFT_1841566, partial [Baffinella frigidus]